MLPIGPRGITDVLDCRLFNELEESVHGDYLALSADEHIFQILHCDSCSEEGHDNSYRQKVGKYFERLHSRASSPYSRHSWANFFSNLRGVIKMQQEVFDLGNSLPKESKELLQEMRQKETEDLEKAKPADAKDFGNPNYQQADVLWVRGYAVMLD